MAEDLVSVVLERASADDSLPEESKLLVLAALESDTDLADALSAVRPAIEPTAVAAEASEPVRAFLSAITVEGFRGIGPGTRLSLLPGPGLVVVAGRNGSGKSSFAEALEVALTRDSYRWRHHKQVVWRESWRNLHSGDPASIMVELAEEGRGLTTVAAQWAPGAALADARPWVQRHSAKRQPGLDALGWARDLELFRPFLSYDELGALFAEPSKLYTALASVLGLERLEDAQARLSRTLKELGAPKEAAAAQGRQLKGDLAELDDERAAVALVQLRKHKPDLPAVAALVTGGTAPDGGELTLLRGLAELTVADADTFAAAVTHYQEAAGAVAAAQQAVGEGNTRKRELLATALELHQQEGDCPCPVCGQGRLNADWAARVSAELEHDRESAQAVAIARRELGLAGDALAAFVTPVPPALARAEQQGRAGADRAAAAWREWAALVGDRATLATAGPDRLAALSAAVAELAALAREELARREDAWQPVAVRLAEWLRQAEQAAAQAEQLAQVKAAADWLKANAHELRNQKLRPLAERAKRIWALLRQESNVDLGEITLAGSSNRRRVELAAFVDGAPAEVLGVMSQGELHALALALFLPKATAEGSPFGFVVIDDPVQAMDPAKVDGLARVLEEIATDRQVIVFTHDDRLPEAVRRLGIDARLVEVTRDANSVLAIGDISDPAGRYLDDARAVASDREVPEEVRSQVIPEMCRMGLEAACRDLYFTRTLRAGTGRTDVETTWAAATGTRGKLALAVGVDPGAPGSLDGWLGRGPRRKAALGICTSAPHDGLRGNPHSAIDDVAAVVADLGVTHAR